jgi:flagellin
MISPISNAQALPAIHTLQLNQIRLIDVLRRLSTGRRINRGADDPAGLIASERLSAQIRSLEAESKALARADANAAIAEGRFGQLSGLFSELHTLVLAGSNDAAVSDAERAAYQTQIDGTVESIRRMSGEALASLSGLNLPGDGNVEIERLLAESRAAAVAVASGGANDLPGGNFAAAQTALSTAVVNMATIRGSIGAYQKNYLMPQMVSNAVAIENLTDSRSRIVDTDYAVETSQLVQARVLTTAGIKALLAVHKTTGGVLDLFR